MSALFTTRPWRMEMEKRLNMRFEVFLVQGSRIGWALASGCGSSTLRRCWIRFRGLGSLKTLVCKASETLLSPKLP